MLLHDLNLHTYLNLYIFMNTWLWGYILETSYCVWLALFSTSLPPSLVHSYPLNPSKNSPRSQFLFRLVSSIQCYANPRCISMRKCRVLPGGQGVAADIQLSIQSNFPLSGWINHVYSAFFDLHCHHAQDPRFYFCPNPIVALPPLHRGTWLLLPSVSAWQLLECWFI